MKAIKIILLIFAIVIVSCSSSSVLDNGEIIVIKGSDTMLHLTEQLSSSFSEQYPNIKFQVYGGGTKIGIEELLAGRIDICTASRNLNPLEAKKLADYYGSIGMYYLVAKDAVSIYVNSESPISNLTIEQIKKIFTCKITNLNELNLGNGTIELAIRDSDSGTRQISWKLSSK